MKLFLTFILIISYYANSCDYYFIDTSKFETKIKTLAQSILKNRSQQEVNNFFKSLERMSGQNKRLFLKLNTTLNKKNIIRSINELVDNPQFFIRRDEFNSNIFLVDLLVEGYAKTSFIAAKRWSYRGDINTYQFPKKFKFSWKLASKEDNRYLRAYQNIHKFFNKHKMVYSRMKDFEEEILIKSAISNPNFFYLDKSLRASEVQKTMLEVLENTELKHGFSSASKESYKSIVLENKTYSLEEWNQMLKDGKIFDDKVFQTALDSSLLSASQRQEHGFYTHRIQWHILMKDIEAFPLRYSELNGSSLFKKLGDNAFDRRIGHGKNGENTSWQFLFDNLDGGYQQPEMFRQLHDDYPLLGAWL